MKQVPSLNYIFPFLHEMSVTNLNKLTKYGVTKIVVAYFVFIGKLRKFNYIIINGFHSSWFGIHHGLFCTQPLTKPNPKWEKSKKHTFSFKADFAPFL